MGSLNKVILIGNLTRDVELRYLPSGSAVAEFGLAMNRRWRDQATGEDKEEVTFVDVTMFGQIAENCSKYLSKGRQAMVEGRLKLDQWDDKQTGEKRYKLKVVGERVLFLGSKPEGAATRSSPQPAGSRQPQTQERPPEHDDVPF